MPLFVLLKLFEDYFTLNNRFDIIERFAASVYSFSIFSIESCKFIIFKFIALYLANSTNDHDVTPEGNDDMKR